MKMFQTTVFLYKVKNPIFGEYYVQTDENFPSPKSPERVVMLYNEHFAQTEYAKNNPKILEETECLDNIPKIMQTLLAENQLSKIIRK